MKYYLSPQDTEAELLAKKPRTSSDYNSRYTNVLASSKVIADTKHLLAIQQERNAALAMLDMSDDDCVTTLHFDTTSRKRINAEWSSVIIRTKDVKKFRMRPLSMTVETRDNITSMIVAALKRLSVASGADSKELWEKVSALMTDSVAKNLHIEEQIANTLSSSHIAFHLLCVSHTCEIFDKGSILVLCKVERKIGLRELLIISHMLMLKSFLSKGRSVTLAALTAFTKLAINDGHKSSLYHEFDHARQVTGYSKKFSGFKERRFAQMGYTAAAIICHLDEFNTILENPRSNNLLVQAYKLHTNNGFILVAL